MKNNLNRSISDFNDLSAEYLRSKRHVVKESTYYHYQNLLRTHISPELGGMLLTDLNASVMEQYVNDKLTNGNMNCSGGLSPKTVKDIVILLRGILKYGRENKLCTIGPEIVSAPRVPKAAVKTLTESEIRLLEQYLLDHMDPIHFGIYLTLCTGLRIGEICALRWENIDIETGVLSISGTVQRISSGQPGIVKTKIVLTDPKTSTSFRKIPLPKPIIAELVSIRPESNIDNLFFLSGKTIPIEPRTYYSKYKMILKDAGVREHTFHELRHTFATRAIEKGMDIKTLSEILGHSSVNITLERYVHSSMEHKRNCMNQLMTDKGSLI